MMLPSVFLMWVLYTAPPKPAPQPSDSQTTTVTVGEMRLANWYYEQYNVLLPKYVELGQAKAQDEKTIKAQDSTIAVQGTVMKFTAAAAIFLMVVEAVLLETHK